MQLGYFTKDDCEAAVHAARKYLEGAQHRRVVFKIDMVNAFSSLRRDVFRTAARERDSGAL